MSPTTTRERVAAALEELEPRFLESRDGVTAVELSRGRVRPALERLRAQAGFQSVTFITAIDHGMGDEPDESRPRFEVVWQLLAPAGAERVRLSVRVAADDARVPSCVDLWPGAAYSERECFDMFGIRFDGHGGLKRLLMPEEYEHHPLRKDFPHRGIEPDKLYRAWDRERRLRDVAVEPERAP